MAQLKYSARRYTGAKQQEICGQGKVQVVQTSERALNTSFLRYRTLRMRLWKRLSISSGRCVLVPSPATAHLESTSRCLQV
jgi:hypothetical protein